jgi:hypothetical protein
MRTRAIASLVAVATVAVALLWTWTDSRESQEAPNPPPTQVARPAPFVPAAASPEQVDLLIHQLEAPSEPMRQRAGRYLVEIGLPALPDLRRALRWGDQDMRMHIEPLIAAIERSPRVPRPVPVGGAEFLVIADPVWKVPVVGGKTRVTVGLHIANVGPERLLVFFVGQRSVSMVLTAADGEPVASQGSEEEKAEDAVALGPGESTTYRFPEARLVWAKAAKELRFVLAEQGKGIPLRGCTPAPITCGCGITTNGRTAVKAEAARGWGTCIRTRWRWKCGEAAAPTSAIYLNQAQPPTRAAGARGAGSGRAGAGRRFQGRRR